MMNAARQQPKEKKNEDVKARWNIKPGWMMKRQHDQDIVGKIQACIRFIAFISFENVPF